MAIEPEIVNQDWRLKKNWGDGDWNNEPDFQFFKYNKHLCVVIRHPYLGHLLGYVLILKASKAGNPEFDVHSLDVHGGITYASDNFYFKHRLPAEYQTGEFVAVGFDCAHYQDIIPSHGAMINSMSELKKKITQKQEEFLEGMPDEVKEAFAKPDAIYRNFEFVKQ